MIAKLTTKKMIAAYVAIAAAVAAHLGFDLDETIAALVLTAVLTAIGISKPAKKREPDGFVRTTLLLVMLPFAAIVAAAVLLTGGCAAGKAGAKAAATSFAECSTAAAHDAARALDPVLGPLVIAAASSPSADLAPLRRVVGLLREDIRRCALEAVRDGILAFLAAAPRTHAQQIEPERVRAVVAEALEGAP
jgi:hypothetical protein